VAEVFVFGSNLAGIHGKGAALHAREVYGAVLGVGVGRTGNAYAIPTKDARLRTLPLSDIAHHLFVFADYARGQKDDLFLLTPIGCGLAGYSQKQIRPLVDIVRIPPNVKLTHHWDVAP
jgi:hypothetical protein